MTERHLVVQDGEDQKYYAVSTLWKDEDFESIKTYPDAVQKWKVIEECNSKEFSTKRAKELNEQG